MFRVGLCRDTPPLSWLFRKGDYALKKKILSTFIALFIVVMGLNIFCVPACCDDKVYTFEADEKSQEELLAEYYAALAKQQAANANSQTKEPTQEELLKQYYEALAKQQGAAVPASVAIVTYKSGNQDKVAVLQNAYNRLPANIQSYFNKANGFNIYACSYDYISSARGGAALGFCSGTLTYNGRTTTIKAPVYIGDRETPTQSTTQILYHELGHAVDYYHAKVVNYNVVRLSDQWSAWQEMQNYTSSNTYNAGEAFAQCFSFFLLDPNGLQAKAPNAYNYMASVIASLN